MSFEDVVDLLDRTKVVAVVTTRAGGAPVATPIWSMVVDGVPYVRSAYGPGSWWYRHILAGRPVGFAMGDGAVAERDRGAALALPRELVTAAHVPADDPVQQLVDEEITRKYAGEPRSSIDSMLSEEARACTLRVTAPPAHR
ncbi:DUF2255 family protein [Georgenia sp. H159]|uniref:DUF2255 family protein n=1 Tax=Georgenia sp. H159 TaxID=3076115 RepID=UPI002D79CE49|nr:DUF2255 family protein [Georgenia sp. H159]